MAGRKGRSVTLKIPYLMSLRELRAAIEEEIESGIIVFQDLVSGEFLLELETGGESLIEEGFDVGEAHINGHPPNAQYTNVSMIRVRSYIEDQDVKDVLSKYGEIKGEVIRLKYKADHELAELQNGNRLVKVLLGKKSIPYSLRIAGEWCRIIHNNQQPVCSECHEMGHTRKRCPEVECRLCKERGHMSYVCEQINARVEEDQEEENENIAEPESSMPADVPENVIPVNNTPASDEESSCEISDNKSDRKEPKEHKDENPEEMETDHRVQGCKRQHSADSDSDVKTPSRRQRINPVPNLNNARQREKNVGSTSESLS